MIKTNIASALRGLEKADRKMKAGLLLYGKTSATKMQNEARKNRPWEDRTGNAKQSIEGRAFYNKDEFVIALSGGVDYFPFLELAHEKKYAILYPTINQYKTEVLKGVSKILK